MKKLISIAILSAIPFVGITQDYDTYESVVSDEIISSVDDLKIVRQINGGTKLLVEYGEECTYDMIGAFDYACKIVEEYLPSCPPITVKVNLGSWRSTNGVQLSKVQIATQQFDDYYGYRYPVSMIKAVLLGEYSLNSHATFFYKIPYIEFVNNPDRPDIIITYNEKMLDEFSFSFDNPEEGKYDFVSVAIRDILRGFGLSSSYTMNPIDSTLSIPPVKNPFETMLNELLGRGDASEQTAKATSGSLRKEIDSYGSVYIYAPDPWVNGVSFNYFIPNEKFKVTKALTYNFGRGTVIRDINDTYALNLFKELLGWEYVFTVGNSTPDVSGYGDNSLLIPYDGSFTINPSNETSSFNSLRNMGVEAAAETALSLQYDDQEYDPIIVAQEITDYCNKYHPGYDGNGGLIEAEALVTYLMKKDGTWDLVYWDFPFEPTIVLNPAEWTLNFPIEEYARTADGYLKGRVTKTIPARVTSYMSYYFVMDYTPQQIELQVKPLPDGDVAQLSAEPDASNNVPVRIYLKNLEGINRVIVERLKQGQRIPSKINVPNFRDGYFDTTLDTSKETTFTAIGYNDNGHTRGVPLVIAPVSTTIQSEPEISLSYADDIITLDGIEVGTNPVSYEIISLSPTSSVAIRSSAASKDVDVSALRSGLYAIICYSNGKPIAQMKFLK